MKNHVSRAALAAILAAGASPSAWAEEAAAARMRQLEAMMQQMLQQRAEQDKQMQIMAEELKAMQQQMAQSKEVELKERGKSSGSPVLASFKDGVTFEDGSGNWQVAINGRVQADYRHFDPDEDAADTFSLRRARLSGTLTFYKDYVVRVEGGVFRQQHVTDLRLLRHQQVEGGQDQDGAVQTLIWARACDEYQFHRFSGAQHGRCAPRRNLRSRRHGTRQPAERYVLQCRLRQWQQQRQQRER